MWYVNVVIGISNDDISGGKCLASDLDLQVTEIYIVNDVCTRMGH